MVVAVTHAKVSTIPDTGDPSEVLPSDWNAAHTVTGLATVAETGAYSDLTGKPTLGALAAKDQAAIADISATGTPSGSNFLRGDGTWSAPSGTGDMLAATYDPTNIAASAFARGNHTGSQLAATISDFSTAADARVSAAIGVSVQAYAANLTTWAGVSSSANGRSLVSAADYAAMRTLLDLEAGTDFYSKTAADAAFQPLATALTNTTASFTTTLETKLNGIEAGADVTDATNVAAAGAVMNSLLTTRGDIITRGASAPQRLALGTSGYYLKSDGTDAVWAAVSSGALVFISEQTAANVASIDFTSGIDSTYSGYEVHLHSIIPATEGALYLRTSTDGGSSFDSGASDYQYVINYVVAGTGTSSVTQNGAAAQILLALTSTNGIGNAASEPGLSGIIRIFRPSDATYCLIRIELVYNDTGGNLRHYTGAGMRKAGANVDAIRFLMASGNITSGHFALYGVAD